MAGICSHCARMASENEELREHIHALRVALGDGWKAPVEFRLTPTQARFLGALAVRRYVTKQTMMTALYGDRIDGGPGPRVLDVILVHVRRKIERHGLSIETVWGTGWEISSEDRERLQSWPSDGLAIPTRPRRVDYAEVANLSQQGLSQRKLAAKIGMSPSGIRRALRVYERETCGTAVAAE